MRSFVLSIHITLSTTTENVECCKGKVKMGFLRIVVELQNTVGSRFTTGLPSRIFGCKSKRRKTSTI